MTVESDFSLSKRMADVCGSALCLLVLAPMMAIVAIAIKLDSPGSVFFRQQRVGRDGQTFEILKFRSTIDGARPRVTRVGGLLRRCSIDELPQLINVLKGETSLVGPRPFIPPQDSLIKGRRRDLCTWRPGSPDHGRSSGPTARRGI